MTRDTKWRRRSWLINYKNQRNSKPQNIGTLSSPSYASSILTKQNMKWWWW